MQSGPTVFSWVSTAMAGTLLTLDQCIRCRGWDWSSVLMIILSTCKILWMITMTPTERLMTDMTRKYTFTNYVKIEWQLNVPSVSC